MNIEEAIEVLKMWNKAEELIINESTDYDKTVYIQRKEAMETLLTAYENLKSYNKGTKEALRSAEELEHQANKEAGDWEARYFELEAELEKEKEKNKKAIDFINDKNNYFEDGENWQNVLKIKEILEE